MDMGTVADFGILFWVEETQRIPERKNDSDRQEDEKYAFNPGFTLVMHRWNRFSSEPQPDCPWQDVDRGRTGWFGSGRFDPGQFEL